MSTALRYEEMPEEAGGESSERQAETLERDADGMVPQKHGGKLWAGRPRNVVAGPGRPRDAVRAAALEGAAKAVPRLVAMLGNDACEHCGHSPTADDATVTRAADVLLKYGLGQQKEITADSVRSRVAATLEVIRRQCPPELAAAIVAELRGVWA